MATAPKIEGKSMNDYNGILKSKMDRISHILHGGKIEEMAKKNMLVLTNDDGSEEELEYSEGHDG